MLLAALVGLVAAFITSMPVAGPVAALIVRNALSGRAKSALMIGVGTGLAEGTYAFLALWGTTFLTDYPIVTTISNIVAAAILLGVGIWFTRFVPHTEIPAQELDLDGNPIAKTHSHAGSLGVERVMARGAAAERPWHSLGIGFSVTILNPTLLATWAVAAMAIKARDIFPVDPAHSWPFAVGVVCGGVAWFALLVWLLSRFRHRFTPLTLQRIIRGMGWGLIGLGIWFAVAFVIHVTS